MIQLKDGSTITIRECTVDDAEELVSFMKDMYDGTKFLGNTIEEFNITVEYEKEYIQNIINSERDAILLAIKDGIIVGNIRIRPADNRIRFRHICALGVSIKKEYRGMGIGKVLMNEAINYAYYLGYEQITLQVVHNNIRAISLYTSLGFVVTGTKFNALKYEDGTYGHEYEMIHFK